MGEPKPLQVIELPPPASLWAWRAIVPLLLGAVIWTSYHNSLHGKLALDSAVLVGQDIRVRQFSGETLRLILTRDYWWPAYASDLYRPVTTLSFAANYWFLGNGVDPYGYHVTNVALHWLNACLVFGLLRRHLPSGALRQPAAFAGAILFAVHPLNTEVVTNVAGRADLLVTLCLLSGLALSAAITAPRHWAVETLRLTGLVLASLLAVLSKESAVVLVPLMVLADLLRPSAGIDDAPPGWRRVLRNWPSYAAVLPAMLLLAWIRHWISRETVTFDQIAADNPMVLAGWWAGRLTAFKVMGYYARLVVWPATLSCDYSYHQITAYGQGTVAEDVRAWAMLAATLLVLAISWRARRPAPWVTFFIGFSAICFLPTSNVPFNLGTIMAERFMYLPLVGCVGLAAGGAVWAWSRLSRASDSSAARWGGKLALSTVTVAVAAAMAIRTHARNEDWNTPERLFASVVRSCPNSFKGYKGLAGAIAEQDPQGARLDECIAIAEKGVAILDRWPLPPEHWPTRLLLDDALFHIRKGDLIAQNAGTPPEFSEASREHYLKARAILARSAEYDRVVNAASRKSRRDRGVPPRQIYDVGLPDLYEMIAKLELRLQNLPAAMEAASYAIHLDPGRKQGYRLLALTERMLGRPDRAAVTELEAILLGLDEPGLIQEVSRDYAQIDPSAPAVLMINGQPQLNAGHQRLRADLNLAAIDLIERLKDVQLPRDAQRIRNLAVARFGCDAARLDEVLRR